ncbi:GerAB/ArcD/ProY family transporter [Paenibacillus piri]|uniref:Spore gernimation protein n=1 Tax=Paenibacillus piri TaxID=2547395 RepID=A0A4R5KYW5_9BACL|nr:endospore germination permease [Paenibacillus piri]TDG00459.1 spore gernimation protein [Paenibacillus piri]
MKKYAFNNMSLMQFIFFNTGIQISVVFLSLPRNLAEQAGTDGWIALIIGWILSLAASLIMIQVMKRYPDGTLLDLLTRYAGKWAGKTAAVLLALYFIYFGYEGIVRAVNIIKIWLLPQTPAYLIMILLLIPSYLIARNGPTILGRYSEIILLMSFWIPIVYLIPLKDAHWLHLLPVFKEGWKPVLAAMPATVYSFVGFVVTMMLYPFLDNKHNASLGVTICNTLTLLTHLFITIICFVYFSPDEIITYNEPVITYLKAIEFEFIERIEILFISFYLLLFSLSWIPVFSLAAICTSWLAGQKDHRSHLRVLWALLAAATFFYLPSYRQSEWMDDILAAVGLVVEYIFPFVLFGYLWIYDRLQRRTNL